MIQLLNWFRRGSLERGLDRELQYHFDRRVSWNSALTIQADRRIVTGLVNLNAVSPGSFPTLGIRILAGRDFDARDSRPAGEDGHRSVIVNEAFVKRYLAGRDPIGIRIGEGSGPEVNPDIVIGGVCASFNYRDLRDDSGQAFVPMFEGEDAGATFYVKVRGAPAQATASIRRIVRQADPRLPILWFRPWMTRSAARSPPSASWPPSRAASARWRCCSR